MWIKLCLALTLMVQVLAQSPCGDDLPGCDPSICKLPDCACTGTEPIPTVKERPQIVYLTFDDAMTKEFDTTFYKHLFMKNTTTGDYLYKNPNGCPIRATFFVTGKSNDHQVTNKYWQHHHEIAAHSITHRSNTTYWSTLTEQQWTDEMVGVRSMIEKFAEIPKGEIEGLRAPYLQGGGDEMFKMMKNNGFKYDCSAPSRTFGFVNLDYGRYPFTYDYYSDMDCQIEPCPQCGYKGIWSQPILDFEDGRDNPNIPGQGYPCGMTDTCQVVGQEPEKVYDMLMKNFQRSYNGKTRAPIGIYIHSAWFVNSYSWHFEGYKMFLNEILKNPDVWIVPIKDGLKYFQNGTLTNNDLDDFDPFRCDYLPDMDNVEECRAQSCEFDISNMEDFPGQNKVRTNVCGLQCPRHFPWLGNPLGL